LLEIRFPLSKEIEERGVHCMQISIVKCREVGRS
jgi:hypothetical protein